MLRMPTGRIALALQANILFTWPLGAYHIVLPNASRQEYQKHNARACLTGIPVAVS